MAKRVAKKNKLPKTRQKVDVGRGRFALKNAIRARQAARRRDTNLLKQGGVPRRRPFEGYLTDHETGESLKAGIIGMAVRANVRQEQMDLLEAMDPNNLADWYAVNPTAFEIYWSYEHIEDLGGYYVVGDEKKEDIDFFIEEYYRLFGE